MSNSQASGATEKLAPVFQIVKNIQSKTEGDAKVKVYRFDIFRGRVDEEGTVSKLKSVGAAYVRDGIATYTIGLKTFLQEKFYLLPNAKPELSDADYIILTRESGQNIGRKYFWNNVGEGRFLKGPNHGLMQLSWDLLGWDIYMNLEPVNVSEFTEEVGTTEVA